MEKKIRTIATLNAHSFSVSLDDVLLQNGAPGRRIKIDHPEAAAIVPFFSEDQILMVRQYRYALGKETLEIPAGKMDPGEKPEACARRELLEETGFEPTFPVGAHLRAGE
jgi:ADP-ribose pyrophosphatase